MKQYVTMLLRENNVTLVPTTSVSLLKPIHKAKLQNLGDQDLIRLLLAPYFEMGWEAEEDDGMCLLSPKGRTYWSQESLSEAVQMLLNDEKINLVDCTAISY